MAKKEWYTIEIECIKDSALITYSRGEKVVVAKVKSLGLAHIVCNELRKVYTAEHFIINCK